MGGPYPLAGNLNRTKRPASPQARENSRVRGFGLELKCYLLLISACLLAHPVDFELAEENFHIYVLFSHSVVSDFATPWKPTFPALAGRFFTAEPPGKPFENSTELCMHRFSSQSHQVDHDPASLLGKSDSKIRICPGI